MYPTIREPKQKRAKEKKAKIIDAGWELISKNGYYNTNTAEIAKEAGVSTGIVYQYFQDKHDILMAALDKHMEDVFFPMLSVKTDTKVDLREFDKLMRRFFAKQINNHSLAKNAHEEIMSIVYNDKKAAEKFYQKEIEVSNKIRDLLMYNGVEDNFLREKIYIMMGIVGVVSQEINYRHYDNMDCDKLIDLAVDNVKDLFKDDFFK